MLIGFWLVAWHGLTSLSHKHFNQKAAISAASSKATETFKTNNLKQICCNFLSENIKTSSST
jgi:formate/nitrite transporter FocA (FNT family)